MKLRSERVLAALVVIGLAAALASAGPVGAAEGNKTKSKITIKRIGVAGASGKVVSKREGCEPHRKVTLFRYDDFISTKVKITQSDGDGEWRVTKSLEPGKYFAKVDAAKAAGTHCLYDVSKNARI